MYITCLVEYQSESGGTVGKMNPLASNIVHTDSNGEDSLLCACSVMNSPNPKTYMYNEIRNIV